MEINDINRKIQKNQANLEILQLEKQRLLSEIDDLDQSRTYIKKRKGEAQERFNNRVIRVTGFAGHNSRGVAGIMSKLENINSLSAADSHVYKAMQTIEAMLGDIDNAIVKRDDRIAEINQQIGEYGDEIERLKREKRSMENA